MGWRIEGWDKDDNRHVGPTLFDSFSKALRAMEKGLNRGDSIDGEEIITAHVIEDDDD